ncbi:hypothetical protein G7046_g1428 [Stylonectria norvegica]|nr:hypothetical protein G7046_g1428 [Stylonectria norvegica]
MPRQIFKGRVLAAAGPLPGQLTVDNLKRWTELRKGQFSEVLDETVTHLLCTREQFNKKVPNVREALKRGKRFHIVHFDWFEFSAVKEKREPEKEYSMRNILAKKNAARRELARIEKGKRDGEKFVNTNLFHIYRDREFFPYEIDLTRDDEATGQLGQRYTLCLWESNAKPHLYWFTAKFLKKKGDSQPSYHRPSICSGKWRAEFDHFTEFFRIKTGIDWEDRVTNAMTTSSSFFQYSPPRGGKPVGRRLRFSYEYCREINAQLLGLPWPPPEYAEPTEQDVVNDGPALTFDESETNSFSETMEDCEQTSLKVEEINDARPDEELLNEAKGAQPSSDSSASQSSSLSHCETTFSRSSECSVEEVQLDMLEPSGDGLIQDINCSHTTCPSEPKGENESCDASL